MNQDFNTFQNPSFSKETYKEESNEQISAKLDNIDKNIVELCNGINAIEEAVNLILSEVKNKRNAETIVETKEESVQEEPVTEVTENTDAQIKAMQELRKEYELNIVDSDLHDNYTKYIQNSLAQLQSEANSSKTTKK